MANLNHVLIDTWFRCNYLVSSAIHVAHNIVTGGHHSALQLNTSGSLSEMMASVLHTPAAVGLSAKQKVYMEREIYRNIAKLPPEQQQEFLQVIRSKLQ